MPAAHMAFPAFLAPIPLPLYRNTPLTCSRPPSRLRMCTNPTDIDPLRAKDDRKEDVPDVPRVGGSVKENVTKDLQEAGTQAGIAVGDDDLLAQTETVVELGAKAQNRNSEKHVQEDKPSKSDPNENVSEEKKPEVVASNDKPTGVKMTPEQVEKAKAARAAAEKKEQEEKEKNAEKAKQRVAQVEKVLVKIGTKSRAFELGEKARANAQVFVDQTIKLKEKDDATAQDKLKASAAAAAKSIVATLGKAWEETLAPQISQRLPEGIDISPKALASTCVGLLVAVVLLPTFFGGGGEKQTPTQKKLDADTASLEKKLARGKSATPASNQSAAEKKVFPPEEVAIEPPRASAPKKSLPAPAAKVAEAPKNDAVSEPLKAATPASTPETLTPQSRPAPSSTTEAVKPVEVTPPVVLAAVTKNLGTNANLVTTASFDSLSAEPTVVFQVTKAFHRLPSEEQRLLADKVLKATRTLGYERVSLIEEGTGIEVAHAGIDIDLEDEAENLRSQLVSVRKQSDKLASQNANQAAELDALSIRLNEERDEFAAKSTQLENIINRLQSENSSLLQDLSDAKEEINKIPDRLVLEERTIEAEQRSDKLTETVEMLSKQMTKAREEEAIAKQNEANSLASAKEADRIKENALASVEKRMNDAKEEAENRATVAITAAQNDAKVAISAADKRVEDVENNLSSSQKEAARTLEETTKSYEKKLADRQSESEKEVQTVQSKYEALLDEVQRKAKAELDAFQKEADKKMAVAMKEAKSIESGLIKERDQAQKETSKVEERASKAAAKAENEKTKLQSKIEKLQARLNFKNARSPDRQLEIMEEDMASQES